MLNRIRMLFLNLYMYIYINLTTAS